MIRFTFRQIKKTGMDDFDAKYITSLIWVCILIFGMFRYGYGVRDANLPSKCNAMSFNDVAIAPLYALGCNMAKKRFNIKLN